ncbi:MAG: DUF5711 family protein [Clostridiales bacterium]|nr:DUF5711 family protein [Clostridiales bacterium]
MENKTASKAAKRKSRRLRRQMTTVLMIAAALCLVIILAGKRETAEVPDQYSEYEPYTYEGGSDQTFAMMDQGLIVASSTGLQLLNEDGMTIQRQVFSLDTPAIAVCRDTCAVYDIGGKTLRLCTAEGEYTVADREEAIISADFGADGKLAVCTRETGYKGLVEVLDRDRTVLYRWHSGSGYLMDACISDDGGLMATLCAAPDGGTVHIFNLSKAEELASYTADHELLLDVFFLNSSTICAISGNQVRFLDTKGGLRGAYDFNGSYLTDYACSGSGTLALYLSKYRSGSAGTLVTLRGTGEAVSELSLQRDFVSMCAGEKEFLVLYSDGLVRYSQSLDVTGHSDAVPSARRALLCPDGQALLLSAYAAEKYSF